MIARRSNRLPATIASRCLRLTLTPPTAEVALAWLEARARAHTKAGSGPATAAAAAPAAAQSWDAALALAGGAPLLALELNSSQIAALDEDMRESFKQLAAGSVDVTLL